jgi:hypothetical protein
MRQAGDPRSSHLFLIFGTMSWEIPACAFISYFRIFCMMGREIPACALIFFIFGMTSRKIFAQHINFLIFNTNE